MINTLLNRRVLLSERPIGIPTATQFCIAESPVPDLKSGEFLVRNYYLSVEPAMRGWVNAHANYSEPVPVGAVMRSFSAGVVVASRHADYTEGDWVMGMFGWQDYAISNGDDVRRKVIERDLPLSLSLGILGINGLTAYFALKEIGVPEAGQTVVVSTAAGAVGSAVGQIAKIMGARTVGIAGGEAKTYACSRIFGFDASVDYKSHDFAEQLTAACPHGIDVYHDNTGGPISDEVIKHINKRARIIICGTASVANWDPCPQGPRVERVLLTKAARMEGFLVWDYESRYEEAVEQLASWVRNGSVRYLEDILVGLDQAPDAIARLYRGENSGKCVIKLGEPQ